MNVLLINGSPHKNGCTNAALAEVAKTLNEAGIETTIFHIGAAPVGGCVSCGGCGKAGKCVFGGPVADVLPLVEKADGIVFGAPVHYATAAASMLGFMHRLAISGGKYLRHKPAAVVTSARRAGTTTALEAMEKVPQFFEMPLISSTSGRWSMAARPRTCSPTRKACRSCATWAATWRGCSSASRPARRRALQHLWRRMTSGRILSGKFGN